MTKSQGRQFHLFMMTGFFKEAETRIKQFIDNDLTSEITKEPLEKGLEYIQWINSVILQEWDRRKNLKERG